MINTILIITLLTIANLVFATPNIQVWHTPEGAKVLFSHVKDNNIVDIKLVFDGASSRDYDKFGLANITNAMIGTGSKKYNEEQINTGFNEIGAIFSTSAVKDMAIISLRSLAQDSVLQRSVNLLKELITNNKFTNKTLTRLKKQYLHTIKGSQTNPSEIASQAFANEVFANHSYAHNVLGTTASITNITINDIRDFYSKYYVAKNLVIVIVGDITRAKAKSISRQLSHNLPIGKKPSIINKIMPLSASKILNIDYPSTQNHILIGKTGINRDYPDYYALYLVNHILGGRVLNSQLGYVIREQNGLAYSVHSYFLPMAANGYFLINLQTKNASKDKAINLVFQTVNDFLTNISDKKIQDAKDNIVGSFALRIATNRQIASYLAVIGFYNLDINYIKNFPEKITKLQKQQIINASNKFFKDNIWLVVNVGALKNTITLSD